MNAKTLIIGIGNSDRQDDGVGWHIVKTLAERLGETVPADPGEIVEVRTDKADLMFVLQIYPELAETMSHYERVCFVDAHTADVAEEISWIALDPEYEKSPLTHHMSPRTLLSIGATIYDQMPEAILVSVRGYGFQFERDLTPRTKILAKEAIDRLWDWINED
jgi:hydrogenase maturation protease